MITLYAINTDERFEIEQDSFPDGTLHINLPDKQIYGVKWNYESDAELFTLICIAKHYNNPDMDLYLPYIPHARMDRVKADTDVFTLKYFCDIINSLNFKRVWVLDAHSNVSLALLNNVKQMHVEDTINDAIYKVTCELAEHYDHNLRKEAEKTLVAFYPDEGSMKRYSGMINMPYAFGIKKRDWATGKIQGLDIMNGDLVKGKNILIIDDICSYGNTFTTAAGALLTAGAKEVNLYITHCEDAISKGNIFKDGRIKKVFTTTSLIRSNETNAHLLTV